MYLIPSSNFEVQDGVDPERLIPTKVEIYPSNVSFKSLWF